MFLKIALNNIKKNFSEYLVLIFSIIVFISIFYIFESVALSTSIKKEMESVGYGSAMFKIINILGVVILYLISSIFLFYFNDCLLKFQQKELGVLQILGARTSKLIKILCIEMFLICLLSSILGSLLGWGFGFILSFFIENFINIKANYLHSFNLMAFLWTFILYLSLFFIISILNIFKFSETSSLKLIKEEKSPNKDMNSFLQFILFIIGSILLISSYYILLSDNTKLYVKFYYCSISIIIGTYLLFLTILPNILKILSKLNFIKYNKNNSLIIGQTRFRIYQYVKSLTITSIVLSMSIGAFITGQGFYKTDVYKTFKGYDLIYNKKSLGIIQSELKNINISEEESYNIKKTNDCLYIKENNNFSEEIMNNIISSIQFDGPIDIINSEEYQKIDSPDNTYIAVKTNDIKNNFKDIEKIYQILDNTSDNIVTVNYFGINLLSSFNNMLYFLGILLGISFFVMSICILLFKLFVGMSDDILTYYNFLLLGGNIKLVKISILKEQIFLFIIPILISLLNVYCGINLFDEFLPKEYTSNVLLYMIPYLIVYLLLTLLIIFIYRLLVIKKINSKIKI